MNKTKRREKFSKRLKVLFKSVRRNISKTHPELIKTLKESHKDILLLSHQEELQMRMGSELIDIFSNHDWKIPEKCIYLLCSEEDCKSLLGFLDIFRKSDYITDEVYIEFTELKNKILKTIKNKSELHTLLTPQFGLKFDIEIFLWRNRRFISEDLYKELKDARDKLENEKISEKEVEEIYKLLNKSRSLRNKCLRAMKYTIQIESLLRHNIIKKGYIEQAKNYINILKDRVKQYNFLNSEDLFKEINEFTSQYNNEPIKLHC